jgi:hypothetical protein
VREPREIEPVLRLLVEQAWQQLERRSPGSLAIGLETPKGWLHGRRLLKEDVTTERTLEGAACLALEAVLPRAQAVSAVELQLGALTTPQAVQSELFEPARPPVEKALRAVEHRYPGLMRRVVLLDRYAYLPEDAYRFEPLDAGRVNARRGS